MIRRLDFQNIQYINLFEKIARVRAADCFTFGLYTVFIVPQDELSKAIGQNGVNAKKISDILKKKIKIIPHTTNKEEFVKAILYPIKIKEIKFENGALNIKAGSQAKAQIIGRESMRLKNLKEIIERYFKVDAIRVM